jgi:hypothetical protein
MRYPSPNRNLVPFMRQRIAALFPGFQLHLKSLTMASPVSPSSTNDGTSVPVLWAHDIGVLQPPQCLLGEKRT